VDAAARKTNELQRTVKSWGSDAPVLASSEQRNLQAMVARKPVTWTITYKP
jgi:hypothetical protein